MTDPFALYLFVGLLLAPIASTAVIVAVLREFGAVESIDIALAGFFGFATLLFWPFVVAIAGFVLVRVVAARMLSLTLP